MKNLRNALTASAWLLGCLSGCTDEYSSIFTTYTSAIPPVGVYGSHRVELRSRARFGNGEPRVTLDGRDLYVTWWTPDAIAALIGAEDRSGKLIVETADGRTLRGPVLHLGQGTDTLQDAWKRHVEDYASRYGFGPAWVSFMKGAYAHYARAFQRQELEQSGLGKMLTAAYHYRSGPRPTFARPWPGTTEWEQENNHMRALETGLMRFFPGWNFGFSYLDDPESNDVSVDGNWGGTPEAVGMFIPGFDLEKNMTWNVIQVQRGDGALPHEIGHRLGLWDQREGEGIPPGEKWCLMGWGGTGLCSGCMCALDIDRAAYDEGKALAFWKDVVAHH